MTNIAEDVYRQKLWIPFELSGGFLGPNEPIISLFWVVSVQIESDIPPSTDGQTIALLMNNLKEKIYVGRQTQNNNAVFTASERWDEFSPLLVDTRDQIDQSTWDIYWTCQTILVMDKVSSLAAR